MEPKINWMVHLDTERVFAVEAECFDEDCVQDSVVFKNGDLTQALFRKSRVVAIIREPWQDTPSGC